MELAAVPATKKQFVDQVSIRLISKLIDDISWVLQKLLRYLNGTIISAAFLSSFSVCPVILCLNLTKILLLLSLGKSIILSVAPKHRSSL